MGNRLSAKKALITGGTSGIGLAAARDFVAEGARLIITGRKKNELDKISAELNIKGIVSDQGSLSDIDELVKQVKLEFGGLDILFINAGIVLFSSVEEATEDHFDRVMDINFKGSYFTLSKFIPLLKKGSSVILLSSINATTGQSNSSVYSASKAAMLSLVKVASSELSGRGIRINAVCPGPITTNLLAPVGLDAEVVKKFAADTLNKIPLKRFGRAEEVAKLVTFLSSDDAAFITGSEYVIDGGTNVNAIIG